MLNIDCIFHNSPLSRWLNKEIFQYLRSYPQISSSHYTYENFAVYILLILEY